MNDLAGDIRFIVPTCMRDRISNFLGASLKLCPSEAQRLKHAVVSTPWYEYYRVANLQAHNILDVANPKLALEQHDNLLRMHLDISVLMLLICQSSKRTLLCYLPQIFCVKSHNRFPAITTAKIKFSPTICYQMILLNPPALAFALLRL